MEFRTVLEAYKAVCRQMAFSDRGLERKELSMRLWLTYHRYGIGLKLARACEAVRLGQTVEDAVVEGNVRKNDLLRALDRMGGIRALREPKTPVRAPGPNVRKAMSLVRAGYYPHAAAVQAEVKLSTLRSAIAREGGLRRVTGGRKPWRE